METKFEVSYVLNSDLCSLTTLSFIPMSSLGEGEGRYTSEERAVVSKFIGDYEIPKFNNDLDGWYEFRVKLNEDIYNLFKK